MPSIQLASIDDPRLQPPMREEWQDFAACAEIGLEPFFPETGMNTTEGKKICDTCAVSLDCLAYQLEFEMDPDNGYFDKAGVFGGLSPKERDRVIDLIKKNPRLDLEVARQAIIDSRKKRGAKPFPKTNKD